MVGRWRNFRRWRNWILLWAVEKFQALKKLWTVLWMVLGETLDVASKTLHGETLDAASRTLHGETLEAASRRLHGETLDPASRRLHGKTLDTASRMLHGETLDAAVDSAWRRNFGRCCGEFDAWMPQRHCCVRWRNSGFWRMIAEERC